MKYIELYITKTAKPMGRPHKGREAYSGWDTYDHETKKFETIKEAQEWLKSEYGKSKRVKSYVDTTDGQTNESGIVIGFKSPPASYGDTWHFEQHWVDIGEVTRIPVKA